MNYKLL